MGNPGPEGAPYSERRLTNPSKPRRRNMSTNVARVTHIIAESPKSFDDAVQVGFARASSTLRGITGLRIVEQRVSVKDNKIATYRVKMEVIFILE
jgi:flavin-binding protein dodecin